ncbi:MAG: pyridoxal-phosphate dependent enzyme [Mariprofundus sp.]|nr:pyridoxal-phosphate dependent enzyme [Mariprofundus sp.]
MKLDSRVDRLLFQGHVFFVKRDDLIDPLWGGNKYRKLYALLQAPKDAYDSMVSYGGTQSNAMLAMAALCHQQGWAFHYTSKAVPKRLKSSPIGNLKLALDLGMQWHQVEHADYAAAIAALRTHTDATNLLLPQGAADPIARHGIDQLAQEIKQWQHLQHIEKLHVVIPSGTGTTAYYLAMAMPDVFVLTTPTVGDKTYLMAQMQRLGEVPSNLKVLENANNYHFAKPYAEFLSIYGALKQAGIEFDLIYACKMWHTLLQYMDEIEGTVLYVHTGGLMGNASMLDRYRHQGMKLKD